MSTATITRPHVALPLASDTFDGPLDHIDADTYECPRCIAERAVFSALHPDSATRAALELSYLAEITRYGRGA